MFYFISLNNLNDLFVYDKNSNSFGSKQIVFGILFDSTFVPALSIVSSSLVAGIWYLAASVSQTLLLYRAVQFF